MGLIGCQNTGLIIKFPDKNSIKPQVYMQYESSRGVGLNHMSMGPIMPADGKAARWGIGCRGRANGTGIDLDIGSSTQTTIGQDWKYGHRATKIVGDQKKLS